MRPESIFVQLPPDLPVFIKNLKKENDKPYYKEQWVKFLTKGADSAFLINPKPKFTSDAILSGDKLKRLIEDNIVPAVNEFELGSNTIYSLGSKSRNLYSRIVLSTVNYSF